MVQRYCFYQHHRSSIKPLKTSARIYIQNDIPRGLVREQNFLASQQALLQSITTKCFLKGKRITDNQINCI